MWRTKVFVYVDIKKYKYKYEDLTKYNRTAVFKPFKYRGVHAASSKFGIFSTRPISREHFYTNYEARKFVRQVRRKKRSKYKITEFNRVHASFADCSANILRFPLIHRYVLIIMRPLKAEKRRVLVRISINVGRSL